GHFLESLWYHPIIMYVVIVALYHLLLRKWPNVMYLYIALGIVVINCILRNVLLLVFHIETI
ncbi:MAG: hypothetical protein IJZ82_08810, partial [Lachnospiraceae bacterium]|nr:hypothetical protein [Lachnospiraceae bacterium]